MVCFSVSGSRSCTCTADYTGSNCETGNSFDLYCLGGGGGGGIFFMTKLYDLLTDII